MNPTSSSFVLYRDGTVLIVCIKLPQLIIFRLHTYICDNHVFWRKKLDVLLSQNDHCQTHKLKDRLYASLPENSPLVRKITLFAAINQLTRSQWRRIFLHFAANLTHSFSLVSHASPSRSHLVLLISNFLPAVLLESHSAVAERRLAYAAAYDKNSAASSRRICCATRRQSAQVPATESSTTDAHLL